MATLAEFAINMRQTAGRVRANATVLQRKVAGAVLQAVVTSTPVGNKDLWRRPGSARPGYVGGRARANWFVALDEASEAVTDEEDAGGGATIENGRGAMQGSGSGQVIHITNNLPYIVPLNEGHSAQAPAGFVEVAVQEGIGAVDGVTLTGPVQNG